MKTKLLIKFRTIYDIKISDKGYFQLLSKSNEVLSERATILDCIEQGLTLMDMNKYFRYYESKFVFKRMLKQHPELL